LTQTTPKHLQTWLALAPNQKTTKKPYTKRLLLEEITKKMKKGQKQAKFFNRVGIT